MAGREKFRAVIVDRTLVGVAQFDAITALAVLDRFELALQFCQPIFKGFFFGAEFQLRITPDGVHQKERTTLDAAPA